MHLPIIANCDTLKEGVFLHAIVNATMTAMHSYYASFLSWDCRNFVLNDGEGSYGAITFDSIGVVAVFFDAHSDFSPFKSGPKYDRQAFFHGMPCSLWEIAQRETIMYNRQYLNGEYISAVTAAFWGDGIELRAAFAWDKVMNNGAEILLTELTMTPEDAIHKWQSDYSMSDEQVRFAQALFDRRVRGHEHSIMIGNLEHQWLKNIAESEDALGFAVAAFQAMGIGFENSRNEKGKE